LSCADEGRPVEHRDAALLEQVERPQAGLDPLHRRGDVDPAEGEVTRAQPRGRERGRENEPEAQIGRAAAVGDHSERSHRATSIALRAVR
jgi:hypothetical protein